MADTMCNFFSEENVEGDQDVNNPQSMYETHILIWLRYDNDT